jgi:DNA polymerase-3 subunit alpha
MKVLFLDLETNGLPQQINYNSYYSYEQINKYRNSRIIQIAYILCDIDIDCKTNKNYEIISKKDFIIKPNGFIINNDDIHGIKHNYAAIYGLDFSKIVSLIKDDFINAELIVAHNILFDKNVLLSELFRLQSYELINHINKIKYFCTSKGCVNITKIKFRNFYKQPKLAELYYYLFKKNIEGQHNAVYDTENLMRCFIELFNKKYVTKEMINNFS